MMTGLEKLRADLDWRTPSGKPQGYVVLERGQAQELLAKIETLQAAIERIDLINAEPDVYNAEINAVCDLILRPQEAIKSMVAESQKLKLP